MTEGDHCIYTKIIGGNFVLLCLYVDDILIASNDKVTLTEVKAWLFSKFDTKDMGEASYVLGVEIHRDRYRRLLGLCQKSYLRSVLKRFSMENCKLVDVPLITGTKLSNELCPNTTEKKQRMKSIHYSLALGCLMCAMLFTRPDLSHAIGILSRYQKNHGEEHWKQIKNVLRYFKETLDYSLCFNGHNLQLQGYTDADWQEDLDHQKSTSGYIFILAGGAISWCSRKQSSVTLSSMEAEYIAASEAAKEDVWLRKFLASLKVVYYVSKDPEFRSKSKHIEGMYRYIRDVINRLKAIHNESYGFPKRR
ncbi:hypothetical protein U9M48_031098 [Paspalum notatum var. saurae]|uniref:Reverse transcriptase Ty1/copia-type domain-containing protein n=1 Tax=Paspalum notatum var. saurae TaxID=547442 RepID=A0AAQ3U1Y4_PASNO